MQANIPVCGKCKGSVVLEPDKAGNPNVWLVCKNCDLHYLAFMNEGVTLSKVEGFVPPPGYSPENPLCICDHTLKWHQHRENGYCIGCDCQAFVPV